MGRRERGNARARDSFELNRKSKEPRKRYLRGTLDRDSPSRSLRNRNLEESGSGDLSGRRETYINHDVFARTDWLIIRREARIVNFQIDWRQRESG
jgi:hypothetical protein